MYSAEVLSQLRTLNWLVQEERRLPPSSAERARLDEQVNAIRDRLPLSILRYHDERAREGLASVANLHGAACGYCGAALPVATIVELAQPGRFAVCPQCGVFVWSGDPAAES